MNHGIIDVFAFQEALLIEAVFGIALLTMVWVGFRRWLQHKEKVSQLIVQQTAEHGTQMQRIEARLKAIEQVVTDGSGQSVTQVEASPNPPAESLYPAALSQTGERS